MKLEHPLIGITFCWVPSHVGIRSIEKADTAAKSALDFPRVKVGVPNTDFKHHINQNILSTWQYDWNGAVVNKFNSVKPVLGECNHFPEQKGRMHLVREMRWNHLDSTPHSFHHI